MSLDWKFTDDEVFKALPETDEQWNITQRLIWSTMTVDIGTIDKKNVCEWLYRAHMLDAIGMPLGRQVTDDGRTVSWVPSRSELEKHIGLRTNVHTITRAQFHKNVMKKLINIAEGSCRRAAEKELAEEAV